MDSTIGFCGVGRMGTAMVSRLVDLGDKVVAWDKAPDRAEVMGAIGVEWASSPGDLAKRSAVVFTSLPNEAALDDAYAGKDGFLKTDVTGKLFIDVSTVSIGAAETISKQVTSRNAVFVECPVGGTVAPARTGQLIGMAGASDEAFLRAEPILRKLCRQVYHLGPVGNGARVKLAVNLPLSIYWEALGEALVLCRGAGITTNLLLEILAESSGGPNALRSRIPRLVEEIDTGAVVAPSFDIDTLRKDLRVMLQVASEAKSELPLVARALECYDAASASGWGARDETSMALYRLASPIHDRG
jgi:3-hydroxyisobutyrate dehydrogenase